MNFTLSDFWGNTTLSFIYDFKYNNFIIKYYKFIIINKFN